MKITKDYLLLNGWEEKSGWIVLKSNVRIGWHPVTNEVVAGFWRFPHKVTDVEKLNEIVKVCNTEISTDKISDLWLGAHGFNFDGHWWTKRMDGALISLEHNTVDDWVLLVNINGRYILQYRECQTLYDLHLAEQLCGINF